MILHPLPENARLLIVKTSSFGDIIHTFPVVSAIAAARPDITIDWLVNRPYTDLVALHPAVSTIYPWDRDQLQGIAAPIAWWSMARQLRKETPHYHAVCDLQGLMKSALITKWIKTDGVIGFSNTREWCAPWFYDHTVALPANVSHAVDKLRAILPALGIDPPSLVDFGVRIPDSAVAQVVERIGTPRYIILNPNARWESKRWSVERFATLARSIQKRFDSPMVIIGGPEEKQRGIALAQAIGGDRQVINLTGALSLPTLAAVIQKAVALVTNDSGPLHLAVATGTKVVALYGPTDPALVGPYGENGIVITAGAQCAPCRHRTCPKSPRCIDTISVDAVMAPLARFIEQDTSHG
jgi:lipopolysaccharide heptosyltransferase I